MFINKISVILFVTSIYHSRLSSSLLGILFCSLYFMLVIFGWYMSYG